MSKVDIFPKRHWVPMKSALVKRKTFLGGLCSIVFVALMLTVVTLTLAEFFTINRFERMTIVAENILVGNFSRSSVDTRVPGDYFISFTLHNFMDPTCTITSQSVHGLVKFDGEVLLETPLQFKVSRVEESAAFCRRLDLPFTSS